MFTDSVAQAGGTDDRWVLDLAPMLSDSSFRQTLANFNVDVPDTLTVPVTVSAPEELRPGQLRLLSSVGAVGERRRRRPHRHLRPVDDCNGALTG